MVRVNKRDAPVSKPYVERIERSRGKEEVERDMNE